MQGFDEIIKEAEDKGIQVGWSNPCFEIWIEQCKREDKTKPSEMCPCTTVHELVGEIKGKVNL